MATMVNALEWVCRVVYRCVFVASASWGVLFLTAAVARADEDDPTKQLEKVLENARLWIVGIAGVLVAVMLTIAGVRYLLGGGDPGETEKAKTALRAAAVGFAIVVLAPILVAILQGILGVD